MDKVSTAEEYRTGLGPREKLITLERGMKMLVQRLPDEAVLEIFKVSGITRESGIKEGTILETMDPLSIIRLLKIAVSKGAKKPRVVLDGTAPKGALHYDELLYTDKFNIMSAALDVTGLGAEAEEKRKNLPQAR